MATTPTQTKLAIDGGAPVRATPLPARGLIGPEEKAAAVKVFDEAIASGNAFGYNGPYEKQYEQDFVGFMGGGFADGVNSGTNSVFCALGALQLPPFSEVIIPPITDPGGAMPVVFIGCVPMVADADPRTFNICADTIKPLISERTKAIVVAHIAGDPVDMDPILDLARQHNLYVVEDCAQSHGATYKGKLVGSLGHIAAFSTMFGKHHCTGGQGGVVYSRDEKLHWQGRRFADRGKPFNLENTGGNVVPGLNCNLNDLSAAIGSVQLKKLPEILRRRRTVASGIMAGLKASKAVVPAWQTPDSLSAYWFMKFRFVAEAMSVDKARFCQALGAEGIPVNPSYRHIPCEHPWFKSIYTRSCSDYKGPKAPAFRVDNAIRATDTHFTLGLSESWGEPEVCDILAALTKVERAYLKDS